MNEPVVFDEPSAGEWVQPVTQGYLMKCCDCGLVHRMDFRVIKDNGKRVHNRPVVNIQGARFKAQFRVYRDD